jgi:hypothetical protein
MYAVRAHPVQSGEAQSTNPPLAFEVQREHLKVRERLTESVLRRLERT